MQVCDVTAKKVNTLEGHSARVGALAWNRVRLSTGSRVRAHSAGWWNFHYF